MSSLISSKEGEKAKLTFYSDTSGGLSTDAFGTFKRSPEEWFNNNLNTLHRTAAECTNADHLIRHAKTLRVLTEAEVFRHQSETTRKLSDRLKDIHGQKSELERHIKLLLDETELLCVLKRRLEKALLATEIPFAIATDNLNCRERRLSPDLVRDPVEEELLKELELIKNVQALLKKTLDDAADQIRLNREAKELLEYDWSDKFEAYNLDLKCGRYRNTSSDTQNHIISAASLHQRSDEIEWLTFTQNNLARAEKEEKASAVCRGVCERVLQETAEDLLQQNRRVIEAFSQCCYNFERAKKQLEDQHAQVLRHIGLQEHAINALQQAVYDKEAPLRVAEARLHCRSHRPNMELCRDQPQISLLREVEQLTNCLKALKDQLDEARASLAELEENRMRLEKDINCKAYSLLIDRDQCLKRRLLYPTKSTLLGY